MQIHERVTHSPFDLDNDAAYQNWKEEKLDGYPDSAEELVVEVQRPFELTRAERSGIMERCVKTNMAIYVGHTGNDPDKAIAKRLGSQFGLNELDHNMGADDDGITALQVVDDQWHKGYIPFSNQTIHWHTDGYYNPPERQIRALFLHCVSPAEEGGENALMDHEVAYIQLRDQNPQHIQALMASDVMTIPANVINGHEIRPARSGPVFSVDAHGYLHMRYTARRRNIQWRQDPATRAAVSALEALLKLPSPYIYRLTLQPGWGLISNNVLHDRSGFNDGLAHRRLLYRLRYYERVNR